MIYEVSYKEFLCILNLGILPFINEAKSPDDIQRNRTLKYMNTLGL